MGNGTIRFPPGSSIQVDNVNTLRILRVAISFRQERAQLLSLVKTNGKSRHGERRISRIANGENMQRDMFYEQKLPYLSRKYEDGLDAP